MIDNAQALREFLATRDAACPSCGYNLRGLVGGMCPECNQEIALRIALVDPRVGLFLVGVVGWALGAGFSILLLVYLLIVSIRIGNFGPGEQLLILLLGALVQGGVLLMLLVFNRRVRRWARSARTLVAVAGFGASLANVLLFASLIQ